MATITATGQFFTEGSTKHYDIYLGTWSSMGNADQGTSLLIPAYADKTVQAYGTFGGATVTIQGSNDDTNWASLSDMQGTTLDFTAASVALIAENPLYIRVITSGGTGTDVTVILCTRKK